MKPKRPGPRPLDPKGRKRNARFEIALVEEEREALRKRAEKEGLSLNSWARMILLRELRKR